MAETAIPGRRWLPYLLGGWILGALAVIGFAWLTTGSYVRQMLQPLPYEADVTLRDCSTAVACPSDATQLVNQQVTLLEHARTVTYLSGWSVAALTAVIVVAASVLVFRREHQRRARILGLAWKVQAAWAALLLVAQIAMLSVGAHTLAGTPEIAQMFTSIKTFDAPFTDLGNLYYLAWFVAVGVLAAIVTRALSRPSGRQPAMVKS